MECSESIEHDNELPHVQSTNGARFPREFSGVKMRLPWGGARKQTDCKTPLRGGATLRADGLQAPCVWATSRTYCVVGHITRMEQCATHIHISLYIYII